MKWKGKAANISTCPWTRIHAQVQDLLRSIIWLKSQRPQVVNNIHSPVWLMDAWFRRGWHVYGGNFIWFESWLTRVFIKTTSFVVPWSIQRAVKRFIVGCRFASLSFCLPLFFCTKPDGNDTGNRYFLRLKLVYNIRPPSSCQCCAHRTPFAGFDSRYAISVVQHGSIRHVVKLVRLANKFNTWISKSI